MNLTRLPAAFALLFAGIAGCSRDPPPSPSPSASATPAETAATPVSAANTARPPRKEPIGPAVVISIERASATPTKNGLLITCETTLLNRTGETLNVATNFQSPFDGLEVVVRSEDGKELARQAYIHHQSPFDEERRVPLPPGPTTKTLTFPIDELTEVSGTLTLKLVGGLPGTGFRSGLASNEVEAAVESKKAAP